MDFASIQKAKTGNKKAFSHLLSESYPLIYRCAFRICGQKEDAEDIAQNVCVKLAKTIQSFDQKSKFSTWLYRITVNAARDFIKRNQTSRKYEQVYVNDYELFQNNPGSETAEQYNELFTAIQKLPQKQKEAMVLVYSEGLSHKEASEALNCAEATVSWRIFQAKRALKRLIK